jgi:hypothetical protein
MGAPKPQDDVAWPHWLLISRQLVIFLLGVGVIIYAIQSHDKNFGYIIAGLVLIGMVPIENFLENMAERRSKRE